MNGPRSGVGARRAERAIVLAFGLSTLAGLALAVVYFRGGQPQWEGALLCLSLGGIGVGLVMWGKHLLAGETVIGPREPLASTEQEQEALETSYERGEELARRPLLVRGLLAAGAALGVAALFPIRSLGPQPGRSLFVTPWRKGLRLVRDDGTPVRPNDLPANGVLTVFPEGFPTAADAQTILVKVTPEQMPELSRHVSGTPEGVVAYSKICTHAGCPVGLYRTSTHELFCPCHQSTFDVLQAARPVFGPAARPLPQLRLDVDAEGYLIAQGDFSEPVGPGFWNRP